MTAVELRIGNLFNENGVITKVSPSTIEELWGAPNACCKAIPLTEEWLLKFGFVTTRWDNFDSYELKISNNDDYAIVIYSDGNCEVGDVITTKINYVHQLQNLFFALVGEELAFKSK